MGLALLRPQCVFRSEWLLEQAEPGLQIEHAAGGSIDVRLGDKPTAQRLRQAGEIGAARHVYVDAGVQRQCRGLHYVRGDPMRDQFRDGVEIADDDALEAVAPPQQLPQQPLMDRHRYAGQIAERRHDRRNPSVDGRGKGREIYFMQGPGRHVGGCVFAPRRDRAIGGEMLCCRAHASRPAGHCSLKAPDLGLGETRRQPGVLARAFRNPPPARVARHVQHRREGQRNSSRRGFARRRPCRCLPKPFVHGRSFAQRNGKDGAVAVQYIQREQQRNGQPRFRQCNFLQLVNTGGFL